MPQDVELILQSGDNWTVSTILSIRYFLNEVGMGLEFYAFNEEDDEAANTSETDNENRDAGECDDDENYCVMLLLSSYMFTETESTYGDGEWIMQIRNNRWNDVQIESMVIILHYK